MSVETINRSLNTVRAAFGVGGVLAVAVGVLILAWPGRTAMVVTGIIAVYAIVAGLVYASLGVFAKGKTTWSRIGHVVLGILFVFAGILAFVNLSGTTAGLAIFLGIVVGLMWLIEGIVALTTLADAPSRAMAIAFAVLSIIAGIVLLFSPFYIVALWWLLGVSFVVLGIVQIVRAFTYGKTR